MLRIVICQSDAAYLEHAINGMPNKEEKQSKIGDPRKGQVHHGKALLCEEKIGNADRYCWKNGIILQIRNRDDASDISASGKIQS